MTEDEVEFSAEVAVHEWVDERIGDVVEEIDIEDESVVRDDVQWHEERWCKRYDEHDRHDEQHSSRTNVCW